MADRRMWKAVAGLALLTGAALAAPAAPAALAAPAQTAGSLTLTPSSGPTGTSVLVEGTLACPDVPTGGTILIRFVDLREGFQTGTNLPSATKAADGSFSVQVTVPSMLAQLQPGVGIFDFPVVPGTNHVQASCSQSSSSSIPTVEAPFEVTSIATTTTTSTPATTAPPTTAPKPFEPPATVPADAGDFAGPLPGSVAPGGQITIDEPGFVPGEEVVVVLYSDPKVLATVNADSTGRVLVAAAVPADTPPGAHTVVLFSASKVVKAPLTVTALPAQAPAATLPRTGPSGGGTAGTAGLAGALLAAGAVIVAAGRRRAGAA